MKKKFLLLFLVFVISFSCIGNSKDENKKEICISNELMQCIKNYIKENEYKIAVYDEDDKLMNEIYYSLLFFNDDSTKYFTIWESYLPPDDFFENNPLLDTNYLYYNIEKKDVFIINNTGIKSNILFFYCEENIRLGKEKNNIEMNNIPIYDGSFYPTTYKYYKEEDKIFIEKLDTAILR